MKSKSKTYPGFSILFSVGSYKNPKVELEEHSIKFQFLFFTLMFVLKDLNDLLESYLDSLLLRIKELEDDKNK